MGSRLHSSVLPPTLRQPGRRRPLQISTPATPPPSEEIVNVGWCPWKFPGQAERANHLEHRFARQVEQQMKTMRLPARALGTSLSFACSWWLYTESTCSRYLFLCTKYYFHHTIMHSYQALLSRDFVKKCVPRFDRFTASSARGRCRTVRGVGALHCCLNSWEYTEISVHHP